MTGLDVFTFVVLFVLLAAVAILVKVLGALPGKIARSRAHPQADAISVCGWLGVLTLGVTWPIALIWAYTHSAVADGAPFHEATNTRSPEALNQTIAELSQRLAAAELQLREVMTQGGKGR